MLELNVKPLQLDEKQDRIFGPVRYEKGADHISWSAPFIRGLLFLRTIQESNDLSTGAFPARIISCFPNTACDTVLLCPSYCICIVVIGMDVRKAGFCITNGEPAARYRSAAVCPRVTVALGLKAPLPVPLVIPCSTAHRTSS